MEKVKGASPPAAHRTSPRPCWFSVVLVPAVCLSFRGSLSLKQTGEGQPRAHYHMDGPLTHSDTRGTTHPLPTTAQGGSLEEGSTEREPP